MAPSKVRQELVQRIATAQAKDVQTGEILGIARPKRQIQWIFVPVVCFRLKRQTIESQCLNEYVE